ncbi:hypothetical protein BGW36DRAFT_287051 [Talaromyces proteolyticus]|uniref:NACHT domain-containing protein n=1 Tax=Talaromyces proteolyticus TaxID=1131652 RepID=A0AAD4KYY6_9EURO|nr:uncharacterized protein BGW36DRAFT_287051 [Talaromyces proteolyticus]KAH8704111.1 hypothetical protein BGW36DRAFT_287051 [Talaromyces proteolyticus]
MASIDPVQQAFADAKHSFRTKLKDPDIYKQILATSNINDVYDATKKLQEQKQGNSRHLNKIKPFLNCLNRYAGVIETFVQVKPEIMALIWGPLKLLLLWSSEVTTAQDKFTNTLVELGHAMPHMDLIGSLFGANDAIKAAMGLLFEDILEFYRISFDFFRKPHWKTLIDALWDGQVKKFNEVITNLRQHSTLLREGVTLADIREARDHRIRSLDLLDETHKYQQRQKFSSLRDRFSVDFHDERLDWIRNRSVSGCEKWLLEDAAFCSWRDDSRKGSQISAWLWFHGIPGAGKTYICGAAIDHLRQHKQNKTLFAFLSYTNNTSQTALTILQSFIFQAAEDDPDFQSVLVDAKERELRGNTGYVMKLLKSWLQTAGPTYVVIDGLDEMECSERQILLQKLEELSKGCDELRFLVCCRLEADIYKALEGKSTNIQVNERNSGSIQTYINSRFDDLIKSHRFDPNTELELRVLLSPLSAKAKGYVAEINSMDEIRSELKALPNDLDDAYKRIFQRINKLPPPRREKRRKILGWIGCAPIPMTIFEMKQALSVYRANGVSRVSTELFGLDFLHMCGPFIEIVNGKLQFVHFTVQEYIFSREIPDFIDKREATRDLAAAFLAYLDSGILEPDVDDDRISRDIMRGKYRLLQYAHFYLPTLLQRLNSMSPVSESVGRLLDRLARHCSNDKFQPMVNSREPPYANDHYKNHWPIGYECARRTFQFHIAEKRWSWNQSNSEAWVNFDPLNTSKMLVRIQDLYEELVHDNGTYKKIETHYVPRLFKCTYLFCTYSRQGFETRHDRDAHITHHERPCKCPVPNCIYFTLGFNTQKRCDEHLAEIHASKFSVDDLSNMNTVDIQPLLFALVMEGDFENIRRLVASPGGKKLSPEVLASARLIGAQQGSLAITRFLAPPDETNVPLKIVKAAMRSQDTECAEWVIARSDTDDCTELMKTVLGVKSEEIYGMWEQYIIDKIKSQKSRQNMDPLFLVDVCEGPGLVNEVFRQQVFSGIKGSILKETRLQHTLEKLKDDIDRSTLGAILVRVAKSSCTLSLAKQLLSYGAPIDHPRRTISRSGRLVYGGVGMTALHAAAKKTNEDAALLIKHLVLLGAEAFDVRMKDEPGPKGIKQFIGLEWSDLVAQAQLTRQ